MQTRLLIAIAKVLIESDFKSVKKKFLADEKDEKDEEIVDQYISKFKELKDQNKIKKLDEKNIDYWGRQGFKEFQIFVDTLSKTLSKREKSAEGAELRAENDLWIVYKMLT